MTSKVLTQLRLWTSRTTFRQVNLQQFVTSAKFVDIGALRLKQNAVWIHEHVRYWSTDSFKGDKAAKINNG